ncbi:MAG: hypothetical protein LBR79_02835 [Oscillospiraceae bacterium]|nr:hypothetical protein [Oscillospiraceae bacterium]
MIISFPSAHCGGKRRYFNYFMARPNRRRRIKILPGDFGRWSKLIDNIFFPPARTLGGRKKKF